MMLERRAVVRNLFHGVCLGGKGIDPMPIDVLTMASSLVYGWGLKSVEMEAVS